VSTLLTGTFLVGLLAATVRIATPLVIGALGETVSERAGIFNVGLDGYMLVGALAGFAASYESHNAWIGVLGGVAGGLAVSAVAGFLIVYLGVDQIVTGIAILILSLGATSAVYQIAFRVTLGSGHARVAAPSLGTLPVPGLSAIPGLGQIAFQQVPLTYLAALLIPAVWLLLNRTRWGLSLRAAGERPWALEAAGGHVLSVRFAGALCAGALGGLAGAFLSIGQGQYFFDDMTAGRGFIVLGIVIFGRWNPLGVTLGALLFAFADAFQIRLQAINVAVPYHLLLMIPYLVTIAALIRASRRVHPPEALGDRYVPAQRA
jgi:ABC-type uncharacterized transport system permease subunit